MGTLGLVSMIEEAGYEKALIWHLQSNLYPPPHPDFYPVIMESIRLANEGNLEEVLTLPNGIKKSVRDTICQLRLEYFLDNQEYDE